MWVVEHSKTIQWAVYLLSYVEPDITRKVRIMFQPIIHVSRYGQFALVWVWVGIRIGVITDAVVVFFCFVYPPPVHLDVGEKKILVANAAFPEQPARPHSHLALVDEFLTTPSVLPLFLRALLSVLDVNESSDVFRQRRHVQRIFHFHCVVVHDEMKSLVVVSGFWMMNGIRPLAIYPCLHTPRPIIAKCYY